MLLNVDVETYMIDLPASCLLPPRRPQKAANPIRVETAPAGIGNHSLIALDGHWQQRQLNQPVAISLSAASGRRSRY